MGVILGVVAAFLLFKSGILNSLGLPGLSSSGAVAPPPTVVVQASANNSAQNDASIASGVSKGLNLIPIAGPAISAAFNLLSAGLIQASQARAKAARDENSAVAAAVPGWDAAVSQIVAAYNAGTISAIQADNLFSQIMANYWSETVPKIQSGRNGCNGGNNCPPSIAPNSGSATNAGGNNYCSGSIGAACCVGCADLQLSVDNMEWAVSNASKTGQPTTAFIQQVFASKYGGANRASYTVTFNPPVSGISG